VVGLLVGNRLQSTSDRPGGPICARAWIEPPLQPPPSFSAAVTSEFTAWIQMPARLLTARSEPGIAYVGKAQIGLWVAPGRRIVLTGVYPSGFEEHRCSSNPDGGWGGTAYSGGVCVLLQPSSE
jgi:hypothetical protein